MKVNISSSFQLVLLFLFSSFVGAHPAHSETPSDTHAKAKGTLTIYTYDSFIAKGSIGELLAKKFFEKTGAELKMIAPGDAALAVSEIEREQKSIKGLRGEVFVGIDLALYERIRLLTKPLPFVMEKVAEKFRKKKFLKALPPDFLPFDYGYFAFIENQKLTGATSPKTWKEFLDPKLKKKLLIEDPRTSTPGLGFFLFMEHQLKEIFPERSGLWKAIRENTLTLAPGWSQAYSLFLKGQAPYVWSYTTSEAYHIAHKEPQYRAVILDEGHPVQIEGAVILKNTPLVIPFFELLLSPEIQNQIPETQWMYPVLEGALPKSFKGLKEPEKVSLNPTRPEEVEAILKSWKSTVSEF